MNQIGATSRPITNIINEIERAQTARQTAINQIALIFR
jgi:hypothetical protein